MARRLEISIKKAIPDKQAEAIMQKIKNELKINVEICQFIQVYNIDLDLEDREMEFIGKKIIADNVSEDYAYKNYQNLNLWRIEIGFLPGVTDNVANTAKQAIKDALGKDAGTYFSTIIALGANIDHKKCEEIAYLFHNPLIEKFVIHEPLSEAKPYIPKVIIKHEPVVERISLHVDDEKLVAFARHRLLALSKEEIKAIKNYIRDEKILEARREVGLDQKVTDVELEAIAQTWSEHCKHKIFNAFITYYDENNTRHGINSLFKTFIKGATDTIKKPYLVSVFKDNGGIIKFNTTHDLAIKVETHNSPSALDPYGGALTGVLGVQRDILGCGLGALPIANIDILCFGYLDDFDLPKGLLSTKRIYEGVIKGVEHAGNKMGIPTVNGSIVFEKNFAYRPLVYAGTIGIMPSQIGNRKTSEKIIKNGYLAVMVGGRIGKDGIHGATFSSEYLKEHTPQSVVQIGDPIQQKKVLDFIIESRDGLLFDAITDNGAGGLSSSIGELAQISNGCEIYLEKCPLKYPGLHPWEILLSESQERMTIAIKKEKYEELEKLAKKHDVEISIVGKFTNSGKLHVFYKSKTVAYLDLQFLHEGMPQLKLEARWQVKKFEEPVIAETNLYKILKMLLGSPNIASKENIVRTFDHEVKAMSVIKPFMVGPTDGAVIKPFYNEFEGVVIAHGICPKYIQDSYNMASLAFDEAVRNAISVGAKFGYLACLDNFSWPDPIANDKNPDGAYKLAQLVRSCIALYDYSTMYGIPIVSGKDSMKNDYQSQDKKFSIPPTLLITVIGKMDNVKKALTGEFKSAGDYIYILGKTRDELGASEYYKLFNGVGNTIPKVYAQENIALYKALSNAVEEGLVKSCHDISDGGIAVAFAECTFGSNVGADLDLALLIKETEKEDSLLFSESAGRFVVSIAENKLSEFEKLMTGTNFARVGRVRGDKRYIIRRRDEIIINSEIAELKNCWANFTGNKTV